MNRFHYLKSMSHLRSNIRSNCFAPKTGKRDFQEQLIWAKSFLHPQPVLLSSPPRSVHSRLNIMTPWCPELNMCPERCRQRLYPDKVKRGVQHFLQEHSLRSCHSQSSTSASAESQTISNAVMQLIEQFENASIPESDISAEYIVAHALGVKQLTDFSRMDQSRLLTTEEMGRIMELASQKLARVPIQYILGEWDFRDLTLKMKPPVFRPRPETEMLVDLLVTHYNEEEELNILEVGCGSGAISLSLLHEFEKAHVTAIDASMNAVMLTQENATSLGLGHRLSVHHTALIEGNPLGIYPKKGTRYDVIVSNPPYVFTKDMDDLDPEILRNEDLAALRGGEKGMDVILVIIKQAKHLLRPHGLIWLETDDRHHQMIEEWLVGHREVSVQFNKSFLDFNDRSRFCQLEYTP